MNRKRFTILGGLVLGCGLLALAPAIAGADDPVLPSPSDDAPAVATSPADFVANLSGGQETPGNASPAFAAAEFRLGADGTSMSYSARVFGLADPTVAHLHLGPLGVSGPIVVPLHAPGQPGTSGCAAIVSSGATTLGGSTDHPGADDGSPGGAAGDDCAAIVPGGGSTTPTTAHEGDHGSPTTGSSTQTTTAAPKPVTFRAEDEACRTLLLPTHAAPPASTSGSSTSTPASDGSTTTVDGLCGFADVSGVITASDFTGPLAGKTFADLVTAIRAGTIYINFHSMQFPAGEVRGQLIPQNPLAPPTTPTTAATATSSTAPTTTAAEDYTTSSSASSESGSE